VAIAASATLLDFRVGLLFSIGTSGMGAGITGSGSGDSDSSGITSTVVVVVVVTVVNDDALSSTTMTVTSVEEETSSESGISHRAWKIASSASFNGRSSSIVEEVRWRNDVRPRGSCG
jgi:hypothetical protein